MHRLLIYIATVTGIAGCLGCTIKKPSELDIFNGRETSDFPEVGELAFNVRGAAATCTGTFVSSNTMITAAHCVHPSTRLLARSGALAPIHVEHNGVTGTAALQTDTFDRRHDLAVLIFPTGTWPAFTTVAASNGVQGAATVVGYGLAGGIHSAGTKRVGTVDIADVNDQHIKANPVPSSIRQGDSGGPLLFGGGLIGVTSVIVDSASAAKFTPIANYFVNLSTADAVALLDRAVKKGAVVDGLNQLRSRVTGGSGGNSGGGNSGGGNSGGGNSGGGNSGGGNSGGGNSGGTRPVGDLVGASYVTSAGDRLHFTTASAVTKSIGSSDLSCTYTQTGSLVSITCHGSRMPYQLEQGGNVLRHRLISGAPLFMRQ